MYSDSEMISKQHVQRSFGRACETYDAAAIVQNEILQRLFERLDSFGLSPARVLDLGCGTGSSRDSFVQRYADAELVGVDIAFSMTRFAQELGFNSICADAERLPFRDSCFDLVFSASTFQWCEAVDRLFLNCNQVLGENGFILFSTFGPDTLHELKHCFAQVDEDVHVNSFLDMHHVGDALARAGFDRSVVETERITVEYQNPTQLLKDLKATGANSHSSESARGLYGKKQFSAMLANYEQFKTDTGTYPATYEVIYGHGWKGRAVGGSMDGVVPLHDLRAVKPR